MRECEYVCVCARTHTQTRVRPCHIAAAMPALVCPLPPASASTGLSALSISLPECLVYLSTDLMALKTYIVSNSTHSSGNDARFSTTYVSSFDDKRRHIHTQTEEGRRIHRHSNISEDIHAQAHRHTLGSPTTCADVDGARVSTCRPQN